MRKADAERLAAEKGEAEAKADTTARKAEIKTKLVNQKVIGA